MDSHPKHSIEMNRSVLTERVEQCREQVSIAVKERF
jgi:hypothetical protein